MSVWLRLRLGSRIAGFAARKIGVMMAIAATTAPITLGSSRRACDHRRYQSLPSSTLLGRGEGGGKAAEGDWLGAERAGAEDEGEHDLQFVQDLVEGHPGAATFGSVRIMVQKAWARTARVTCRCQPVNERPSKWSRPRPVLSSR